MSQYAPHEALIQAARASASLPRLLASLVMLFLSIGAFNLALGQILLGQVDGDTLISEMGQGSTPRGVLLVLFSFLTSVAALWVVLRLMHQRGLRSLLGPVTLVYRDFFRVMRLGLIMVAVILILPVPEVMRPHFNLSFSQWLPWLPLGLTAVLVQVTTEELIFRGYFQSQLAARSTHPLVWMVLPSLLFGFLHYSPDTYGDNALLIAIWSMAFGCAAADLTARSGSLGPAIALHFVNNVSAILIVSMQSHWDGLALLSTSYAPQNTDILRAALWTEGLALLCLWLVARIAIRR
ncbi:CPBP family intramembrane metalloprotease [Cognatishimia sp. WU-CL00825]|uniref:CPBP family intramembrane glutamic endopeptidase n=1 Tax=Cognatishimia sp. WU-CL00825 TaxID=3127658 RepID=UPI003102F350